MEVPKWRYKSCYQSPIVSPYTTNLNSYLMEIMIKLLVLVFMCFEYKYYTHGLSYLTIAPEKD